MGEKPHVILIPFGAQGHVMPLMKLSIFLVDRGFRVTFVNTESIHAKLIDSLPGNKNKQTGIDMVAIPDGLTPEERNSPKLLFNPPDILPKEFGKLVRKILESRKDKKIACVIADETVGWALEVSMKMGIPTASFFPQSAGVKALLHNVPNLIKLGVIDDKGNVTKNNTSLLSSTMPETKTTDMPWFFPPGLHLQQQFFHMLVKNAKTSESTDWLLCNSSDELEHAAISLVRNLLPIGPLLATNQIGNFWPEDSTCMEWLNQQVSNSIIYIAFGSHVTVDGHQLRELALGLELLGRPFLWVVRATEGSEITYPDGFQDRVFQIGKIVAWAPQQKVLAHPSIACFISHCGWNSTMDGVSMGIPFLSWPSFADQFSNRTSITDTWKVGLGLNPDEDGIVSRDEIRGKISQLLEDKFIRENSLKLKQITTTSISKGGSSFKNFEQFVEEMKK